MDIQFILTVGAGTWIVVYVCVKLQEWRIRKERKRVEEAKERVRNGFVRHRAWTQKDDPHATEL